MSASSYVQLKNGIIVPLKAVELALDLERRGCRLAVDGEDLMIGPPSLITDADRHGLRQYKLHVRAILQCCDGAVQ